MKKIISEILKILDSKIQHFYIVGGLPRDRSLNKEFHDVDIILPLFKDDAFFAKNSKKTIKKQIGTVLKRIEVDGKPFDLEISPIQAEGIEQDLESRDLTINSIAYKVDVNTKDFEVIDPSGGINDLHYQILRCYHKKNLENDPIRLLRIFRFQAVSDFDIDSKTLLDITYFKSKISNSPNEMICEELIKTFSGNYCVKAFRNMASCGLLSEIIPETDSLLTFLHQDPHHYHESVFEHSLHVLRNCLEENLGLEYRVAALFHDIAKPLVFDGKHYIGHENTGVKQTEKILKRLRFSKNFIKAVLRIIAYHMIPLDSQTKFFQMRYNTSKEAFEKQVAFIKADKKATNCFWEQTKKYQSFLLQILTVKQYDDDGFFEHLNEFVNGRVLMKFGLKSGIGYQSILEYLRKKLFKKPEKLSKKQVRILLEQNLFFKGHYSCFQFGSIKSKRIREYINGKNIYGLLEDSKSLFLKSGIFNYNYFSEGEFINWEKENQKSYSLFF